jgi:uncharacterized phage-associated protein
MAYSSQKMQHVILFFLERINNVHLGRTKLMKLLYYVDFDHYEKHGRLVTGATYKKLPHGPVPEQAGDLIQQMNRAGLVRTVVARIKTNAKDYEQHRLIAQSRFDASKFSGDELQTLERVAKDWEDATASDIEAASHAEAPWANTKDRALIDYELAYYRRPIGVEPLDNRLTKSSAFAKYVAALA